MVRTAFVFVVTLCIAEPAIAEIVCSMDANDCSTKEILEVRQIVERARYELQDEDAVFSNVVVYSEKCTACIGEVLLYRVCGSVTMKDMLTRQPVTEKFKANSKGIILASEVGENRIDEICR